MKYLNIPNILAVTALSLAFTSCEEVQYAEHTSQSELSSVSLSARIPQVDPGATAKYKDVYGVIDNAAGTVTFDVPYNLSEDLDDVTDLSKVFLKAAVPVGAIINPGLGGLRDMTSPLDIRVTAGNGTYKDYTLIANLKKSSENDILSFSFSVEGNEFSGICKPEDRTVTYMVPNPEVQDLIACTPAIANVTVSSRAKIVSPDFSQPINFSEDVKVIVEAQDGSQAEWTIVQSEPLLLEYGFGYTRKLWEFTAENGGFGNSLDYRGMTVTKNYVVVSARDFGCLLFDKQTGAAMGKAAIPADLNDSNKAASMYCAADEAGNLVACSFPSWTTGANFVVYYWKDGETVAPTAPIIKKAGMGDCGRKFAVVGDLSKDAIIYTYAGKGKAIYKFYIVNGVWDSSKDEKVIITEPNSSFTYCLGIAPLSSDANADFILVDQVSTGNGCVSLHEATGAMKMQMTDGAKCREGGITSDAKVFSFNNAKYLMYIDANSNSTRGRIRIYDITQIDRFTLPASSAMFDSFLVFQGDDMPSTTNGNGTGAVAVEVSEDGSRAYVHIMLTNGGVQRYELTNIAL